MASSASKEVEPNIELASTDEESSDDFSDVESESELSHFF